MKMLLKINNSPRFLTIFFASSKWIFLTLLESHMNFFAYADTTLLGLPGAIDPALLFCWKPDGKQGKRGYIPLFNAKKW